MAIFLSVLGQLFFSPGTLSARPTAETPAKPMPRYDVRVYHLEGNPWLNTNIMTSLFVKHTGKDVPLDEIIRAAADLQLEYQREGRTNMNIVIAPQRITNGVAPMSVFAGAVPQILVAGNRYVVSGNIVMPAPTAVTTQAVEPPQTAARASNVTGTAADQTASRTATNAPVPHFEVRNYVVTGNTLLPPAKVQAIITNVPGAIGTNVTVDDIRAAATELQLAYRARGFVTVAVSLPPQKLTNATVKIQVTEGRLSSINVKGNRFFSSNNVMRALPGLHTNMILNNQTFQAELNRANASRDRQIYPVLSPGPDPGTSDLTLKVKDQYPFHAKVELNNQASPGTPDLRVNGSAVYDNLFQQEQSIGAQYSFSPERLKEVTEWENFDRPLVANYSGFYRIPLGGLPSLDDVIASQPGSFGYNEATRKFVLPPASGQADLTFFASRSTIDTGLNQTYNKTLFSETGFSESQQTVQEDLTGNNDVGFRLTVPLHTVSFHSSISAGLDFKTYQVNSFKTNIFTTDQTNFNPITGQPILPPISTVEYSAVPTTVKNLQYLPLSVRFNADGRDALGYVTFGVGVSANLFLDGLTSIYADPTTKDQFFRNESSLQQVTGSTNSSTYWVVLTPSVSHDFELVSNWPTRFKIDGQWASQPLIANEQFGAGGVNSVRGYHEGEVFGDTGWHVSLEQTTPPHIVGYINGHNPLTIRGSLYTDFAETYLLDPLGRAPDTALWGVGVGGVASVGSHWSVRFLFSVPMLTAGTVRAYDPFFNFSLTAEF